MKQEIWYYRLTFFALIILSLGIFTSVSFSAVSHIILVIPGLYFAYQYFKQPKLEPLPYSFLALAALLFCILMSVALNTDIMQRPQWNLFKAKYFAMALLSFFAFKKTFEQYMTSKRIKLLLYLFLTATTIASISGFIALKTGYNPLKFKAACHDMRTCGLYGMYMTYGYGIGLFLILVAGLLIYWQEVRKYIPLWFLVICLWANGVGLFYSYTRGAWIGFAAAIPFFFLKRHKKAFVMGCIAAVCLWGVSVMTIGRVKRMFFSPSRTESSIVRYSFFKAAWKAYQERPVFGYGYKNFEPHVLALKHKYAIGRENNSGHAHNNFVEHLASTGIMGFLALFAFHLFWAYELYRRDDLVARVTFPFVIGFFISGQSQYTFGDGENLFLILTVYALSQVVAIKQQEQVGLA